MQDCVVKSSLNVFLIQGSEVRVSRVTNCFPVSQRLRTVSCVHIDALVESQDHISSVVIPIKTDSTPCAHTVNITKHFALTCNEGRHTLWYLCVVKLDLPSAIQYIVIYIYIISITDAGCASLEEPIPEMLFLIFF